METSDYFVGCDCASAEALKDEALGAEMPGQGPFVTIHVRNVPELVKKEGGAAGATFFNLVPQTIENAVYSKMASEIGAGMKQKGVDADIQVVTSRPAGGPLSSDFLVGSLTGAAAVGVGWALYKLGRYLAGR